jgi:type IV pilus assembly protein PilM
MARFLGIDVGDTAVKLAEIDGSYRKTRLVRWHIEPLPAGIDGVARAEAVAEALKKAMSETRMSGEPVLGHPCREAVLRTIDMPFSGTEQIRKVVKGEVEGAIFSHPVDEMIVDFHEIGKTAEGTKVLVAAIPKAGLRVQLAALERYGIEPERVDLDTMALYRAAHWADAFEHPAEQAELPATTDGASNGALTAVLDLGARSSRVLLVEGENLVDMRTLRLGDAMIADELMRKHGVSLATAREAVQSCLKTGGDFVAELPAPVAEDADEEVRSAASPAVRATPVEIPHTEVEAGQTDYLQRLARELVRFLTGTGRSGSIRALWITGGASRLPGIHEMLTEVFGCAPKPLGLVEHMAHDLSPEDAATADATMAAAVGLALSGLGGPEGFQLRQEDLSFTRGFDRVKFPLAITCMVAVFAAVVFGVKLSNDLKNHEFRLGRTYPAGRADPKGPQFYGMLHSVISGKWFDKPEYFTLENKGKNYDVRGLVAELLETDVTRRLVLVRDKLRKVLEQKQETSGVYEDLSLESGLAVLVRWAEVMTRAEASAGRYLLFKLDLKMKSANAGSLDFTVALRGGDDTTLRTRGEAIRNEFLEELKAADTPSASVPAPRETPASDSREMGVPCLYLAFSIKLKDEFSPFGGARVGLVDGLPGRAQPGLLASADGEEVRK